MQNSQLCRTAVGEMFMTMTAATMKASNTTTALPGVEVGWDGIAERFQMGYQDVFKTSKKVRHAHRRNPTPID